MKASKKQTTLCPNKRHDKFQIAFILTRPIAFESHFHHKSHYWSDINATKREILVFNMAIHVQEYHHTRNDEDRHIRQTILRTCLTFSFVMTSVGMSTLGSTKLIFIMTDAINCVGYCDVLLDQNLLPAIRFNFCNWRNIHIPERQQGGSQCNVSIVVV